MPDDSLFKTDDRKDGQSMTFRYTGGIWQAIGLLTHCSRTLEAGIESGESEDA